VYSILLLLHVACALVGFGALAMTGSRPGGPVGGPRDKGPRGSGGSSVPGSLGRPCPVRGAGLRLRPHLDERWGFSAGDGFVIAGLGLWSLATVVAEVVVWPGEASYPGGRCRPSGCSTAVSTKSDGRFESDCRRVGRLSAALLSGVFITAVILMVAQP